MIGIGLDVEESGALEASVVRLVLSPRETERLESHAASIPHVDRLIFSAKESVYKCLFPVTRRAFDFHDVEIHIGDGSFEVEFRDEFAAMRELGRLTARFALTRSHVMTGVTLVSP